jgi:small-conductance mechanosensitive channel
MIERFFDNELLDVVFWGNSVSNYIDALLYFLIALIILYILQRVVMTRFEKFAKKTKTEIDDVLVKFIHSIRPRLYVVLALYISLRTLNLSEVILNVLNVIVIIVIIFQVTKSLQVLIEFAAKKLSGTEDDEHAKSAAHLLGALATIAVWIFGILMILANVGVNVASLIAGVGIGGIAIAFAIKEVLADLFSSFAIYFDKPFKAGDLVKLNDKDIGTVQKIGIKTTRIKSRTGEELVVSNQDLTSSRLRNFKRMEERNVRLKFIVEFNTPTEKLKQLPSRIKEIVDAVDNIECKRVHFKEFGDWGLVYEVMFTVDSRDYTKYMDTRQDVNLGITALLDELNIVLAHPERGII